MADMDNNSALTAVTSHVEMNGNSEEVAHMNAGIVDEVGVGVTDEDMLQNDLVDPSSAFPVVQMQYTEESEALHSGALINNGIQFITDTSPSQDNGDQLTEGFVSDTSVHFINDTDFVSQKDKSDDIDYPSANDQSNTLTEQQASVLNAQILPSTSASQPQQIIVQQHMPQSSAPLGSSQNPIRIIQQGNQYTPVQQLSTDQLQQIMQVVQQQQINRNVASGSSVLFNPQTNTRIVYRVIYPAQLHKDGVGDATKVAGQQTLVSYVPRKAYKKRKEEEPDRIEGPELSKEEKEQRKKMRPKTRSGRISKPPKHMVKDFKHIHVLDYDEDYDDSDGGYSDFKYEGEDEPDRKDDDENFVSYAAGVDSVKPKRWKCITCEKAYIGRAGLARHLRLNPSHGTIDIDGEGDMEPPDPNITPVSSEDMTASTPATPNGINSTANSTASFSEDSRDSSISLTYTPTPRSRGRGRGRAGRGSWRGRGVYSKVDPETRRINKLKEITKECSDEELMEIVLPRLAKVITLWEFLLMKVEKGNPAWPHADDIYKEYMKIHEHVKKLCQEYLQFVAEPEADIEQQQSLLQVENTDVAQALGLQVGSHKVREIADTDTDLQYKYKFLTTNQSVDFDYTNKSFLKRTVEVVSPEQIVSPAKKFKQTHPQSVSLTVSPQRNLSSNASSKLMSVTSGSDTFTSSSGVNSVPFKTKIKIISPQRVNGKVSQCSNSGKPISGKAVSLLTNSFSKHSPSSSSSSLSSSSSSSEKSSQKVIIISGTNSSPQSSASAFTSNSEPVKSELPGSSENQSGNHLNDQSRNQFVTLSNGQGLNSQNRIILHDSVTGTYTVCSVSNNLTNSSQAAHDLTQTSTSEPVILDLPPSSNQKLQPKLVLNDMNLLNSVPSETSEFQPIITNVTGENIVNRQILNIKTEEERINSVNSVPVEGISVTDMDPSEQNLILTLPSGDPIRVAGNDHSAGNVVYALTNGDSSQENVIFTVDPNSMLVTQLNGEQSNEVANEVQNLNGNDILETIGENEVVGVIDSIDTSEQVKDEAKWRIVENVSPNEDMEMNGDAIIDDASINEDQAQLAALSNSEDKLNNIGPKVNTVSNELEMTSEDGNPEETIQIPATNIYQTEDGMIFIQNPDGTTLQLQGSDGQAVSMETVQALLGMVTETSQPSAEQNTT